MACIVVETRVTVGNNTNPSAPLDAYHTRWGKGVHSNLRQSSTRRNRVRGTQWRTAVDKGSMLCLLMRCDIAQADEVLKRRGFASSQSRYTRRADLDRWGYGNADFSFQIKMVDNFFRMSLPIHAMCQALGLDQFSHTDGGNNHLRAVSHECDVVRDGVLYKATQADFRDIFNPIDGVIYVWGSYGPRYQGMQQTPPVTVLPELQQWSDITFITWQALAGQRVRNLHYVFVGPIVNKESQDIIHQALKGRPLCTWTNATTFPMSSDEGKAILSSPNGNGVAWLLINHKEQLGMKVVESVTVFVDDSKVNQLMQTPSLLFTISDL